MSAHTYLCYNAGTDYELGVSYTDIAGVVITSMSQPPDLVRVFFILKLPAMLYTMDVSEERLGGSNQDQPFFRRTATSPFPTQAGGIQKQDLGRRHVIAIDLPITSAKSSYSRASIDPWFLLSNFKGSPDFNGGIALAYPGAGVGSR